MPMKTFTIRLFFLMLLGLLPLVEGNTQVPEEYEGAKPDNQLIYIKWDDKVNLYTPDIDEDLIINGFSKSKLIGANTIWFIKNSVRVDHSLQREETNISIDGIDKKTILSGYRLNNVISYSEEEEFLALSYNVATTSMLALYDIANKKTIHLPLIGQRPSFNKDYLYFSSHHICDWYSVYTEDVYRVKIGDWNNPELVLENVDPGNWFLIPESNVIYADILEEQGKGVLYNADTRSYKIVDAIYGDRVIKYKGEYYYELKPNNKPISYRPVNLPSEYPQKDDRVLCPANKKRYFNLSNSQKPFTGTFINNELLYNAPEATLNKLDKEELRLLRNAFFARQGYQFKSDDLQEFFRQFEWYNELLKSYKVLEITNEDVVISPKDKERVELIMKIENRK